jgi:hypothetical protein
VWEGELACYFHFAASMREAVGMGCVNAAIRTRQIRKLNINNIKTKYKAQNKNTQEGGGVIGEERRGTKWRPFPIPMFFVIQSGSLSILGAQKEQKPTNLGGRKDTQYLDILLRVLIAYFLYGKCHASLAQGGGVEEEMGEQSGGGQ